MGQKLIHRVAEAEAEKYGKLLDQLRQHFFANRAFLINHNLIEDRLIFETCDPMENRVPMIPQVAIKIIALNSDQSTSWRNISY